MPAYGLHDAAVVGQVINIADMVDSKIAQDAAGIAFGAPVFVKKGEDRNAYNTSTGGGTRYLLGVAILSQKEYAGAAKYNQYDAVNVLRLGRLWVLTGNVTIQNGDAAYWDATNSVWTNVSTSNFQTPYYFRSSTSSGGLAELDVMPGIAVAGV